MLSLNVDITVPFSLYRKKISQIFIYISTDFGNENSQKDNKSCSVNQALSFFYPRFCGKPFLFCLFLSYSPAIIILWLIHVVDFRRPEEINKKCGTKSHENVIYWTCWELNTKKNENYRITVKGS